MSSSKEQKPAVVEGHFDVGSDVTKR